MVQYDAANTGFAADQSGPTADPAALWQHRTGANVRTSPVVVDNRVYVGTEGRQLVALDAITGEVHWTFEFADGTPTSPVVAEGTVYVTTTAGRLVAIDATSGTEQWSAPLDGDSVSPPVIWQDYIYTTSGTSLLSFDDDGRRSAEASLSGDELSQPAVTDTSVYVGSDDGSIYAFDLTDDTTGFDRPERWRVDRVIDRVPAVTVANDTVYVAGTDPGETAQGRVYALDPVTGSTQWQFTTTPWIVTSPAVTTELVYVGAENGDVIALYADSGIEKWRFDANSSWQFAFWGPGIEASPIVAGQTVYVGSEDGYLYALDAENGTERWRFESADSIVSTPTAVSGLVYVGSDDGGVYAITSPGSSPVPLQDAESRGNAGADESGQRVDGDILPVGDLGIGLGLGGILVGYLLLRGSDESPDDSSTSRPRVTVERETEPNEEEPSEKGPKNAEREGAEDEQIQALEAEVESALERVDELQDEITELVVAGERDNAEQARARANQELERLMGKLGTVPEPVPSSRVQPLQEKVRDEQESLEGAIRRARELSLEESCEAVERSLASVNGYLSHGNVDDAEEALDDAEQEIQEAMDRLAPPSDSLPSERIESLQDRIDTRRDDIEQVREWLGARDELDDSIQAAREDVDAERWQPALAKLDEARDRSETLMDRDVPYLSTDSIQHQENRIDELQATANREYATQRIESLLDECETFLDEAIEGSENPDGVRETVESKLDDARDHLSASSIATATFDGRVAELDSRVTAYEQSRQEATRETQPQMDDTTDDQRDDSHSTAEFAVLTAFQRDLLVVIAGHEDAKGLAIRDELETYYDEDINHGRLYPNLDTLAEKELVDKFELDERSNGYRLTETGRGHLERRQAWQRERAPDSDVGTERSKRERIFEAIDDVATELGRMPKRNEFLDRTDWDQGDVTAEFESWQGALEAAGISVEAELLSELEHVAEAVDGEPTSSDMNREGAYNAGKYSTYFGSWAAAVEAADLHSDDSREHSKSTPGEQEANDRSDGETASHEDVLDGYFTLAELPNESRFHGETAVYVTERHNPDETKDARLSVQDVTGTAATFNVWAKHDCEFDWAVGEWYVLSEVRLRKWERNGETMLTLSSSRDTTVTPLSADAPAVDEKMIETPDDESSEGSEDETKPEDEFDDAVEEDEEADANDESEDEPDGGETVLDEIVSEFDNELM
ncbi:outer membrane protein assembly factor BamB family protein [Halomicrobium zhouii]